MYSRTLIHTECGKLFDLRKQIKLDLHDKNNQETKDKLDQVERDIANKIDEHLIINTTRKQIISTHNLLSSRINY